MERRWLITGCSSGLGLALATAAAREGHRLAVTARNVDDLERLSAAWPDHIIPVPLELRDSASCEEAVRSAADSLGGIDILVNNAGCGLFDAVEEVSDAELRDQLETLLVGPWRLTRLVLPLMRAQGHGHILNVSSVAGRMAFPGLAAYVAGKHARSGTSTVPLNASRRLGDSGTRGRLRTAAGGWFDTARGDAEQVRPPDRRLALPAHRRCRRCR
ncbi:SDR family NAD(P)-dependent oxidoreductase [Streptomyces sp. SCSIO 30461]|uniref:SDR family NAD(P)-dependent oxidoreductase n=1 Tax=Streptomyces sp. SCSIO 30461 TaxID=3118085 RepID=UPI0030CEC4CB